MPLPDLTIAKADNPDPAGAFQLVTYTLTVSNLGAGTAAGVLVLDQLAPEASEATIIRADGGFICTATIAPPASEVRCTGGVIAGGGSATITFDVRYANVPYYYYYYYAPPSIIVTNTAIVDPDNTISESNEGNNTAMEATTILRR